ncbi:twin-arginine translocase subunit TatC, partial [Akkermansiaceae bacterium]|nr:twin-arginine translocase subunit TatC [Akkermansiaceae bacterium]
KAALIYRAVKELPEDEQTPFIESIPDADKEVRELAAKILISEPAANLNSQGNLRIMSSLKPTETFMLTMKLAFFAGIVISFPFLLYFLLQFVLPGLKKEERRDEESDHDLRDQDTKIFEMIEKGFFGIRIRFVPELEHLLENKHAAGF